MDTEYTRLRDKSLDDLKKYMDSLDPEKGQKLAYWVSDYVHFLKKETTFDSGKLIRYKRGAIVKAHLGYRVGSEEGGLHYAVVMDANNAVRSPTVTVIPLTSIKSGFDESKLPRTNVCLGDEVYTKLDSTLQRERDAIQENLRNLAAEWASSGSPDQLTKDQKARMNHLREEVKYCNRMIAEIGRMKQGSIALVGQITTISKIRIYDPKYSRDALANIRISDATLNLLDQKVQELFGPKTKESNHK